MDKYRKQVIHGVTSAKVATCLLKGAPVTQYEIDRIYDMVLHHDIPHPSLVLMLIQSVLLHTFVFSLNFVLPSTGCNTN